MKLPGSVFLAQSRNHFFIPRDFSGVDFRINRNDKPTAIDYSGIRFMGNIGNGYQWNISPGIFRELF